MASMVKDDFYKNEVQNKEGNISGDEMMGCGENEKRKVEHELEMYSGPIEDIINLYNVCINRTDIFQKESQRYGGVLTAEGMNACSTERPLDSQNILSSKYAFSGKIDEKSRQNAGKFGCGCKSALHSGEFCKRNLQVNRSTPQAGKDFLLFEHSEHSRSDLNECNHNRFIVFKSSPRPCPDRNYKVVTIVSPKPSCPVETVVLSKPSPCGCECDECSFCPICLARASGH